jgi:hypothetical protein
MKKTLLCLLSAFLMFGIYSCTKTDDNNAVATALCSNGIKDPGETEIDCGGPCTACLPPAKLTCTLGGTSYISEKAGGQTLGPSIRVYSIRDSAEGRPLNFMFLPGPVNQPLRINSLAFSFSGEPYNLGDGDSGVVVLTALDTVKKIISGTFYFTGKRLTTANRTSATDGVFTNVRYQQ